MSISSRLCCFTQNDTTLRASARVRTMLVEDKGAESDLMNAFSAYVIVMTHNFRN